MLPAVAPVGAAMGLVGAAVGVAVGLEVQASDGRTPPDTQIDPPGFTVIDPPAFTVRNLAVAPACSCTLVVSTASPAGASTAPPHVLALFHLPSLMLVALHVVDRRPAASHGTDPATCPAIHATTTTVIMATAHWVVAPSTAVPPPRPALPYTPPPPPTSQPDGPQPNWESDSVSKKKEVIRLAC